MKENLVGWIVGLVLYLLFMARDVYRVCYAPFAQNFAQKGAAKKSEQS